ncbi:unnamed protein product [marine sediment metagenome]|uniref:Pterin-binding domain-containing protein n=1 Tax=marine sediment metagenome TaxID=412755 RepID=X0YGB7_9ZZZZ
MMYPIMAIANRKNLATVAMGIAKDADIFRLHDVKEVGDLVK